MVSVPLKADSDVKRPNIIAMVWAPEENRTATYARLLNAPVFYVHYLLYKRPYVAPFKYVAQALKTFLVLFQERPKFVYITNPPVFAPLCVFIYSKLTGTRYIMDTHSPALFSRRWGWTLPLQRFLMKHAYMNLTDQQRFKDLFEEWGARAIILEKPPKNVSDKTFKNIADSGKFDITVVNTFAVDEPVDIILEAARQLPEAHFYILGDKKLADPADLKNAPANVTFTDYLLGDDYWNRIYSSRALMSLTTYPYSLLAGAQDGAALGKPLLLSKQPTLEEMFPKGAVFFENTAEGIVSGVKEAMAREQEIAKEVVEIVEFQANRWQRNFDELVQMIEAAN